MMDERTDPRTGLTPGERDSEITMMSTPDLWPVFVLPLKRAKDDGGLPDVGVLSGVGARAGRCTICLGNMFDSTPYTERETEEYDDFGAAFDAGWRVD